MIAIDQNKKAELTYNKIIFLIELCEYQRQHNPEVVDYVEIFKKLKDLLK